MKIKTLVLLSLFTVSCKKETKTETAQATVKDSQKVIEKKDPETQKRDTIVISTEHKTNKILCDLDGDDLDETVEILRSTKNQKSGLRIIYGNGKKLII